MKHLYIDLFFAVNWLLDGLLLWATGFLSGAVIKLPRIALAAGFGAAGASISALYLSSSLARHPFSAAIALGMSLMGFGKSSSRLVFLRAGLLYAISCVLSGFLSLISPNSNVKTLPFGAIALFCFAGVLLAARLRSFRSAAIHARQIIPIVLVRGSRQAELRAFLDTGLTLTCPLSNRPVMVVTYSAIFPLLSSEARFALSRIRDPTFAAELLRKEGVRGVTLIPYRVVGSESNLLCGFVPDVVIANGKKYDCVIGITFSELSESGDYEALSGIME